MQSEKLELATVWKAAPEAHTDFQKLLTAAVADCKARPACRKVRKVVLTFFVEPRESDPEDVVITPVITSKTSAMEHQPFIARATRNNQLVFDFPEEREAA